MIESKTTLTMRCDKCQSLLTSDGHIIETTNDYFEIYKIAKSKGWSCNSTKGCLCPVCAESECVK